MQNNLNFNGWRAVGYAEHGVKHLIYMGISMEQVKKNYPGAFYEILQTDEQTLINRISLERWSGSPDSGKWVLVDVLKVPRVHSRKRIEIV